MDNDNLGENDKNTDCDGDALDFWVQVFISPQREIVRHLCHLCVVYMG